MKLKRTIFFIAAFITALGSALFTACNKEPLQSYVQQLNYTESTEKIDNPDQGFYRPLYVKVTESGVAYNKNVITPSTRLYHLRIDISEFSKAVNGQADKPLSQPALDGLDELLSYIKQNDKNAIVRFAYDPAFNGSSNKEPELQTILGHANQLCNVINAYQNTVTAIETGFIGPWGEMHTSSIANSASITPLIETLLNQTENIPVLARTPKMIYDVLGITINDIDGYTVNSTEKAYRLGLYNDGYLGSESDLGTYTDRQREVAFLSGQTGHLPFGGEVVAPESGLHDIQACLPEMNELNLSYLNAEWNNLVIGKWKNSAYTSECGGDEIYYGKTAYEYIENHMGYRFVLKNSVLSYSEEFDKLNAELTLQNVGFGNLNRSKRAQLILTDGNGEIVFSQEVQEFTGSATFTCSAKPNIEKGSYDVYLRIYGEQYEGAPLYCLQFANGGLWNEQLKANKIGVLI